MPIIRIAGRDVPYEIRRSDRALNVRLKVDAKEGLVVVVPRDYEDSQLPAILHERSKWIEKQLAYFETAPSWESETELHTGQRVLLEGRPLTLEIADADAKYRWSTVGVHGQTLKLSLHPRDRGRPRHVLERWLRARVRERIEAELESLASGRRIRYGRLYVMDQKTRWGNCSRLGNLSFNWRLVMAPPQVLRYVVTHELAHLVERKHSPRFWLIVTSMVGDVEGPRLWLRKHGGELRL